jgi:hypothetical protein
MMNAGFDLIDKRNRRKGGSEIGNSQDPDFAISNPQCSSEIDTPQFLNNLVFCRDPTIL